VGSARSSNRVVKPLTAFFLCFDVHCVKCFKSVIIISCLDPGSKIVRD
jgi:hypothetical protein